VSRGTGAVKRTACLAWSASVSAWGACVVARFGDAHTSSPDARVGHPALWLARHWLRFAILALLATDAVSRGVGNHSLVTRRVLVVAPWKPNGVSRGTGVVVRAAVLAR